MFSKQFSATIFLILASIIWGTAFVAQTTGMDFYWTINIYQYSFCYWCLIDVTTRFKRV